VRGDAEGGSDACAARQGGVWNLYWHSLKACEQARENKRGIWDGFWKRRFPEPGAQTSDSAGWATYEARLFLKKRLAKWRSETPAGRFTDPA